MTSVSSPTLQMRVADVADLPAVLRLYQQPDLDQGQALSLAAATQLFEKIQQYPSYRLVVAELSEQIVGTLMLLVMDNLLHRGTPTAIVEAVAVDPQCQGQGIGRQMMQWAMAEAHRAGCYKLVLSSNQRRDRAHAFYESLGFTRHGYSFCVALDDDAPAVPAAPASASP
ncbi:MAG: GNAT family N-acetyltransferase [Cyanobacteria bacterium P01_E01_bin.43]